MVHLISGWRLFHLGPRSGVDPRFKQTSMIYGMFEFYFFVSRKKQKLYKFFVFLFSHMMNLSCLLNINDVLAISPNTRTRFRA